jgi:hypothetical protein
LTRTDLPHRPRDAAMLTEHYVEVHYCHLRFLRGVMPSFFLQAFVDLPLVHLMLVLGCKMISEYQ